MDNMNTGPLKENDKPQNPPVTPMEVDENNQDGQTFVNDLHRATTGPNQEERKANEENINTSEEGWKMKFEENEKICEKQKEKLEEQKKAIEKTQIQLNQQLSKNQELDIKLKETEQKLEVSHRNAEELSKQKREEEDKHNQTLSNTWQYARQEIQDLQQQLKSEKAKKDAALTRFSELAGARISEGNSAIADLGDERRPQKLAEILSEIYDNEWTDVYEAIEKSATDRETIAKLLKILQGAFAFCSQVAEDERKRMNEALKNTFAQSEDDPFPGTVSKKLKDFLKSVAQDYLPVVIKRFFEETAYTREEVFKKYTRKCLEFSWFACCQDPPLDLVFDINENDTYDSNSQSQYTHPGPYIDFLVWPVLCIEKNGALLSKGVVQCKDVKSENKNLEHDHGEKLTNQETVKTTDSINPKEDANETSSKKEKNQESGIHISRIPVGPNTGSTDNGQPLSLTDKNIQEKRSSLKNVTQKDQEKQPIYDSQK